MALKYYLVQSREDFANLLSVGFGYEDTNPWSTFDNMFKLYKENSCVNISFSARTITYANLEYYLLNSYTPGTIDDVSSLVKQTRLLNGIKRKPGRPRLS